MPDLRGLSPAERILSFLSLRSIRLLAGALTPALDAYLYTRCGASPSDKEKWRQLRGVSVGQERPPGLRCLWFHAASVGETVCLMPLIKSFDALGLGFVLVTTTTETSGEMLRNRRSQFQSPFFYQRFPIDSPVYVRRFLTFWKPDLAVFSESQIWINTMLLLRDLSIPNFIVNGRMSLRTFKTWRLFGCILRYLLQDTGIICQDETSARRFELLCRRPVEVSGNLKFEAPTLPFSKTESESIRRQVPNTFILLAASFHPGEERYFLRVYPELLKATRSLLIILVPRHPDKTPLFLEAIQNQKTFLKEHIGVRSRGCHIGKNTQLYVADSIGELGLWYSLCDAVLMGGTFSDRGGQNPIEPARFGKPILAGPSRFNFQDVFRRLESCGLVETGHSEVDVVRFVRDVASRSRDVYRQKDSSLLVDLHRGGLEKTVQYIMGRLGW